SVMPLLETFEIAGARQSTAAVACRTRFVPPAPSSASTYWAVIRSPLPTDSAPSEGDGGAEVVGMAPMYRAEPGGVSVRTIVWGAGSVVDQSVAVVVEAPMLASWTVMFTVVP